MQAFQQFSPLFPNKLNVAHHVFFVQLPLVRDGAGSSFRQDNDSLFSGAARNVLTGVPFLFARVVFLLALRVFGTLHWRCSAVYNHFLDIGKLCDKLLPTP